MKYELYSGAGNDFVMINNFTEKIPFEMQRELTVKLCTDNFPEIDGVIFADRPTGTSAAVRMNYYNRDGSFGAMCGNGARCIAMFVFKNGITEKRNFMLEAVDDIYSAEIPDEINVTIGFPEPKEIKTDIRINDEAGKQLIVNYSNVGSDHIILFINDDINKLYLNCSNMDKLDVDNMGRMLRYHKEFKPRGANVNFAEVLNDNTIRLRTYERGVERETLACGTGIISTGIIALMKKGFTSPVNIKVQSGEVLQVNAKLENGKISELFLTGSARKIGEGSL